MSIAAAGGSDAAAARRVSPILTGAPVTTAARVVKQCRSRGQTMHKRPKSARVSHARPAPPRPRPAPAPLVPWRPASARAASSVRDGEHVSPSMPLSLCQCPASQTTKALAASNAVERADLPGVASPCALKKGAVVRISCSCHALVAFTFINLFYFVDNFSSNWLARILQGVEACNQHVQLSVYSKECRIFQNRW